MAFIVHIPVLEERRRRQEFRRLNIRRRHLRDIGDPFGIPNNDFERLFRVDKHCVRDLMRDLGPALQKHRSDGIPVYLQILITLHFLGYGSYQRAVGEGFLMPVSQPTVSRCVRKVTQAIYHRYLDIIRFPSTNEERNVVQRKFHDIAEFPGILGCIDCTHIAITTPWIQEDAYKNHHGFYSLNVQMICDSQLKILNVHANYPGSVHDQFIFNTSIIKIELQRLHQDRIGVYFLLGDSGYALEKYMLTPVLNADYGTPEERYTLRHCQVRNVVERLFGVLKAKWRCLRKERALHYQPRTAAHIVYACAILHNLTLHRLPLPEVIDEPEDNPQIPVQRDRAEGRQMRNFIINTYFVNN